MPSGQGPSRFLIPALATTSGSRRMSGSRKSSSPSYGEESTAPWARRRQAEPRPRSVRPGRRANQRASFPLTASIAIRSGNPVPHVNPIFDVRTEVNPLGLDREMSACRFEACRATWRFCPDLRMPNSQATSGDLRRPSDAASLRRRTLPTTRGTPRQSPPWLAGPARYR